MSKYLILLIFIFFGTITFAQNYQAEYLEAKRLYNNKEFKLAKDAFQSLTIQHPKNQFASYASFYFGLAAYQTESYDEARDMWLQLLSKYPNFKQKDEVNWWLASTYIQKGEFLRASNYLKKVRNKKLKEQGEDLKASYLSNLEDLNQLISLYNDTSKDELIGQVILDQMVEAGALYENEELALELIKDLKLNEEDYFKLGYTNVKKDIYNVAVLLPFRFDSLEAADRVASNRQVMDLYEGLKLAADQLNDEGFQINLLPYDTKGQSGPTKTLLANDEMKGMDLIIGPLFVAPFRLVHAFSKENKINMIGPLTTNIAAMGDNPFSFLYKVGDQTQAIKLAEYANKTYTNKTAYIYYEQRDSSMAATYKNELEKYEFEVPVFQRLKMDSLKAQAQALKAYDELDIRSTYHEDSLAALRHVSIERKRVKNEIVNYAEILRILPDSVGHIFVTSKSSLAASNFITSIIERPDTISIIGRQEWLSIQAIPFRQFEVNEVSFIAPIFMSSGVGEYDDLRQVMIRKYKSLPSNGHFTGYDIMYTFGKMMHEHGKYFQDGFRKGRYVESKLSQGFQYFKERDNQVLPIIKLIDSQLIDVNRKNDEY